MKIAMNRKLKISLIGILVVIIGSLSFLLYNTVQNPGIKEEKIARYSYNNKPDVRYRVFLKQNILYEEDNLDEGKLYLTQFIDYIRTYFSYEFSGERRADIKGDYSIVAVVEGYMTEKETTKTIWQKEFILSPRTNFEGKDEKITIGREVLLRLDEYNNFASQINESTKLNIPVKLSVVMDINMKTNTDKGEIVEKFRPSIIVPLNTSYFEIEKKGVEEKPGAIEETKQVSLKPDMNKIIPYGIIIGISTMGLLFLLFFTSGAIQMDPYIKELKKIFKTHGNRLVALNSEITVTCKACSKVRTIEDLVRIADEIGKPILYQYSSDFKDITQFYVADNDCMYILDLSNAFHDIKKTFNEAKDDVMEESNIIAQEDTAKE